MDSGVSGLSNKESVESSVKRFSGERILTISYGDDLQYEVFGIFRLPKNELLTDELEINSHYRVTNRFSEAVRRWLTSLVRFGHFAYFRPTFRSCHFLDTSRKSSCM